MDEPEYKSSRTSHAWCVPIHAHAIMLVVTAVYEAFVFIDDLLIGRAGTLVAQTTPMSWTELVNIPIIGSAW